MPLKIPWPECSARAPWTWAVPSASDPGMLPASHPRTGASLPPVFAPPRSKSAPPPPPPRDLPSPPVAGEPDHSRRPSSLSLPPMRRAFRPCQRRSPRCCAAAQPIA
ncbi:unnamed protein product, partial [Ectocarpus sp. 12 AP-2014]